MLFLKKTSVLFFGISALKMNCFNFFIAENLEKI